MCSTCLHVPVMSWLVETGPRHRCILAHWHSTMLWEVSRAGHWAHYLSAISEGPLLRGSGPIATSVSASEAKSNRCLPRCWVEKPSCLELLWNTLMGKKKRWGEQWTKIKNSEGSQERWKNPVQNSRGSLGRMSRGPLPVHRRVLEIWTLIWTVQSNTCRDTSKSTQSIQTALLHWLAFSFQRMLSEKGIFGIPKGSADTQHTNARTGKNTRRIKQTLLVQGLKKFFPQSQTDFQIFFCTASLYLSHDIWICSLELELLRHRSLFLHETFLCHENREFIIIWSWIEFVQLHNPSVCCAGLMGGRCTIFTGLTLIWLS